MKGVKNLSGRTILVTGASSGIGRDLAISLAASGAAVALCARRRDRLSETTALIEREGGRAAAIGMDVTDERSVIDAFDQAEAKLGPVNGVAANAGVNRPGAATDLAVEDFDAVMAVNVRGVFLTAREAARRFRLQPAGTRKGSIVIIASIGGLKPLPGSATYSTSKAAVVMLGKALAQEWVVHGINVNVVCPGYISTELNSHLFEGPEDTERLNRFPRKRLLTADDLSPIVSLLFSEAAEKHTGGVFTIDDGQSLF